MSFESGQCVLEHHQDSERPRRALDGLSVCGGHRAKMLRQLRQLGPLDRVLAERAVQVAGQRAGSRSAETRIPYDAVAAPLRHHLRQKLAGWVHAIAHDRGFTGPDVAAAPTTAPVAYEWRAGRAHAVSGTRTDLDVVCGWLERQHDWICASSGVGPDKWTIDDYATDLAELHSSAWSICYPSGRRRIKVADCRQVISWIRYQWICTGRLVVSLQPGDDTFPDAVCDLCHQPVPPSVWLRWADKDRTLSALELSMLWGVPLKTVERWARDDHWPHDDGRPRRYLARIAQRSHDAYRMQEAG